jgi:dTDP-4-amino-4,6-dideoxygalactose transaminase
MEPYRSTQPEAWRNLPETERISARVIVMPTGQAVDEGTVKRICSIVRTCVATV